MGTKKDYDWAEDSQFQKQKTTKLLKSIVHRFIFMSTKALKPPESLPA
jgi:hypothetical protein